MTDQVRIEAAVRVTTPDGEEHTLMVSNAPEQNPFGSADLTYSAAAELTARIGDAVQHTEELIVQAYIGRAWLALNYSSWDAWVDEQFGDRPLMQVTRSERLQAILNLKGEVGLSNRAIGRALGVGEATVRRELKGSPAPNDAGGVTIGQDGKSYDRSSLGKGGAKPAAVAEELFCYLCEQPGHETDDCPELSLVDNEPITIRDEWVDDEAVFGPGAADQSVVDEDETLDLDEDFDDLDTEDAPLPEPELYQGDAPDVLARRRVSRMKGYLERIVVARDDLDEVRPLVESLRTEATDWPDRSVKWPATMAEELRTQLAGIRAAMAELSEFMDELDTVPDVLAAVSR